MSDMKTPTLNVNLVAECLCLSGARSSGHRDSCPAKPVLIPCPIPRSVTFTVRLGACRCFDPGNDPLHGGHWSDCKGGPIRVTCSISGKTWEESDASEVTDIDIPESLISADVIDPIVNACRDRWALVKALVTDAPSPTAFTVEEMTALFTQRDAVFAALAEQARLEEAVFEAQERATKAMGEPTFLPDNFHRAEPERRPAAGLLERYVARLIEQVGNL